MRFPAAAPPPQLMAGHNASKPLTSTLLVREEEACRREGRGLQRGKKGRETEKGQEKNERNKGEPLFIYPPNPMRVSTRTNHVPSPFWSFVSIQWPKTSLLVKSRPSDQSDGPFQIHLSPCACPCILLKPNSFFNYSTLLVTACTPFPACFIDFNHSCIANLIYITFYLFLLHFIFLLSQFIMLFCILFLFWHFILQARIQIVQQTSM